MWDKKKELIAGTVGMLALALVSAASIGLLQVFQSDLVQGLVGIIFVITVVSFLVWFARRNKMMLLESISRYRSNFHVFLLTTAFLLVSALAIALTYPVFQFSLEELQIGLQINSRYRSQVTVGQAGTVHVEGFLSNKTVADFEAVLDAATDILEVQFNSRGGKFIAAVALAEMIETKGYQTSALGRCESACTIPFLASEVRIAVGHTKFGFHRTGFPGTGFPGIYRESIEIADDAIKEYSISLGVDPDFVKRAWRTPHDSMWYPSKQELIDANFITHIRLGPGERLIPVSASAFFNRGASFFKNGAYDQAIEDYTEATRLKPNFAKAYVHRGNSYGMRGDGDHAKEDYDRAIKLDPNNTLAHLLRAVFYLDSEDCDQAIEDFNELIRLKSNLSFAYEGRGVCYVDVGDIEQAIEDNNEAIRLNPFNARAYNVRGMGHRRNGNYEQAIRDFTEAIELAPYQANGPSQALLHGSRGKSHRYNGNCDLAIEDYTEAIKLDPDYADAFNGRGICRSTNGNDKQAIEDYSEAIRLDPSLAYAHYNRGIAFGEIGNNDLAIVDYNEAIRLKPDYAIAYNNRGICHRKLGNYDKAIKDYNEAIRLNPDDASAYNNKAMLLATNPSANVRNGPEAVRAAQKAVELDATPGGRDTLAAAYAEVGDFPKAIAEQEAAIEMARDQGLDELLIELEAHLDLYHQGKPLRTEVVSD